jgi:hypothetical protein
MCWSSPPDVIAVAAESTFASDTLVSGLAQATNAIVIPSEARDLHFD